MSSPTNQSGPSAEHYVRLGWEAALRELHELATALEARGANRAAVTLYDAVRLVRARRREQEQRPRG